LALTEEEHKRMQNFASKLIQAVSQAVRIKVTNPSGTDLELSVEGRRFFTDTKIDWEIMKWVNLPTGEVIVAPIEHSLEGRLVCDMAIGGIGPIAVPVEIMVKHGKVREVRCEDQVLLEKVKDTLTTDEWSDVVGEFALGINPKARLVKEFLEDEKILGTAHVAFGHNLDMPGGSNPSKNHMDFLFSKPTIEIIREDGTSLIILEKGKFRL
jgi:leucyl aminopeptidase (aminopeptidase T)